jgi:hypothetical protein
MLPKEIEEVPMAQKLDEKELIGFNEVVMANSKMLDALVRLLFSKRFFTGEEFYAKV